jgi:hypothetical protein
MKPALDPLESRQLLSATPMSAHEAALVHHHHHLRLHNGAVVGRAHTGHPWGADPAASSTGFQVVKQFNNASFNGTVAIADNDVGAVGSSNLNTSNQQPLAVHFDGSSWSAVSTPTLKGVATFSGVPAVGSNDVWAVGYQEVGNSTDTLIEHWDGTNWSTVSSPHLKNGTFLSAVTAISANNVWAGGSVINSSGSLVDLVEHRDGTSWSVVSSPAFTGAGIQVVAGISADASYDIWAVTNSPTVLHFHGTC